MSTTAPASAVFDLAQQARKFIPGGGGGGITEKPSSSAAITPKQSAAKATTVTTNHGSLESSNMLSNLVALFAVAGLVGCVGFLIWRETKDREERHLREDDIIRLKRREVELMVEQQQQQQQKPVQQPQFVNSTNSVQRDAFGAII